MSRIRHISLEVSPYRPSGIDQIMLKVEVNENGDKHTATEVMYEDDFETLFDRIILRMAVTIKGLVLKKGTSNE